MYVFYFILVFFFTIKNIKKQCNKIESYIKEVALSVNPIRKIEKKKGKERQRGGEINR